MADTNFTFTLNLDGTPTVYHHCDHKHSDDSTWRIDSDAIYLHGTVEQLRAFGESVLAAAADYEAQRLANALEAEAVR